MNRILVRLPNWVGDVIMATPMLRALRAYLPEAQIDLVGKAGLEPLVAGLPYYDAFLPFERGWRGGRRLVRALRPRGYDVALVLPHSFGAAWPMALARVPRRIGYTKYPARRWLLTDPLPVAYDTRGRFVPTPMHELYLGFVRALGGPAQADVWPKLPLTEETVARVRALREAHGLLDRPYVVVNPGAHFGASKLWTADGFAGVADALAREAGAAVVLVGGPGEGAIGRAVMTAMREPAVDLCTESIGLAALYGLIAECALLVSLDSGPRHMAVAARKPVVVVMGPTDPRFTNCCLDRTEVVRLGDLYCIGCHYKVCPTEHECMRLLPPARVLDAARRLLRAGG